MGSKKDNRKGANQSAKEVRHEYMINKIFYKDLGTRQQQRKLQIFEALRGLKLKDLLSNGERVPTLVKLDAGLHL